LEIGHFGKIT